MAMTVNLPLLRRVLQHIDAHPALWEQENWFTPTPCGTAACVAGWACLLSGDRPVLEDSDDSSDLIQYVTPADGDGDVWVEKRALHLLGIDRVWSLFKPENTRSDIQRIAEMIARDAGEDLGVPLPVWA